MLSLARAVYQFEPREQSLGRAMLACPAIVSAGNHSGAHVRRPGCCVICALVPWILRSRKGLR